MNKPLKTIDELYANLTYLDQFAGSVVGFILTIVVFFVIYSYTQIMVNVQPIKDNWTVERCSPQVIPFAGLINKPDDMSVIDFTGQNFTYCMQHILTNITGNAVQPITYLTTVLNSLFDEINEIVQFMRNILANIRADIAAISSEIMTRILNIMIPIQSMMIGITDLADKVKGILTAGVYTSLGTYYLLQSLLGAIVEAGIIVLIILVAVIMVMWMIPFFWLPAALTTVVFGIAAIIISIILVFMADTLNVHVDMSIPSAPSKPTCFDKNTAIKMNDNTYKSIFDINVGEKLANNNLVTATFKLSFDSTTEQMYTLNNIYVSGSHRLPYCGALIYVADHPDAKKIVHYHEPYVYCINTISKEIICRNFFTHVIDYTTVFSDWDELCDDDIVQLLNVYVNSCEDTENKNKAFMDILEDDTYSIIHHYFDGGFFGHVPIKLVDGSYIEIQNVAVGDILSKGEIVYGIVEIDAIALIPRPDLINNNLGINLHCCCDRNNDTLENIEFSNITKSTPKKIYHLLTNTRTFYVNGIRFYHYNASIDLFLDKYRKNLLSIKYV